MAITSTALAAGAPATPASTIRAVTLYPGVASVERVLHLPAGSTQAVFACLPAQLDPRSLQVRSDRSVRIGEVNVQTLERRIATGCDSAVAERIRSAQDDVARAQAEVQGLELAHTWLTTQAGAAPGTQGLPPPPRLGPKPKPCAAQRSIPSPNWPAPSAAWKSANRRWSASRPSKAACNLSKWPWCA